MGFLNEPEQGIELASQGFGQDAGDTEKKTLQYLPKGRI